ncbi:MAG: shikimate kinase, partial [Planctomycetota bacterium]
MPKEKSNVVLIGMPGCGKSTIGVLLAKRLQMAFVDTDRLIETRGMDSFCEIECGHNQKLDVSNTVIATGGSVVYYDCPMRHFQIDGIIVYLYLPKPELCQRLGDLKKRGVVLQPGQTLDDLYEERTPLYE